MHRVTSIGALTTRLSAKPGPVRRTTRRGVLIAAPAAAAFIATASRASAHDDATPVLDDPVATGTELVERFVILVAELDIDGLDALLVENYVIQRSVGPAIGKAEYLETLPNVIDYEILDVQAWQTENVLVVRWNIQIELELADGTRLSPEPTNYLTTFIYLDGDWRVVAHANFAPVATDGEAVATPLA